MGDRNVICLHFVSRSSIRAIHLSPTLKYKGKTAKLEKAWLKTKVSKLYRRLNGGVGQNLPPPHRRVTVHFFKFAELCEDLQLVITLRNTDGNTV